MHVQIRMRSKDPACMSEIHVRSRCSGHAHFAWMAHGLLASWTVLMAVLPAHTYAAQEKKPPKPKPAEPLADAPTGPQCASTCAAHAPSKC